MLACVDSVVSSILVHVDCTMNFGPHLDLLSFGFELHHAVDLGVQFANPTRNFVEIEFVLFVEYVLDSLVHPLLSAFSFNQPEVLDSQFSLGHSLTVVLLLADVSGHRLKDIVEQKLAELVEGGDLQARNVLPSENLIFSHQLPVCDQIALSVTKSDDEILKLVAADVASRVGVKFLPHLQKFVNVELRDGQTECVRLAHERVDDDGDEEIQENLGHNHRKRIKVQVGDPRVSASIRLHAVCLN